LVSIIVVTIGSNGHIYSCLESIRKQVDQETETIVIDNSLEENASYCSALNKGIRLSKGSFILCINDDVILDSNFISEALNGFNVDVRIGMVSGKILRIKTDIIDSSGLFLSCMRTAKERGYGKNDLGQFGKPGHIFGVNGAVAFYRREMLEDIKQGLDYFDSDFRFFYEDLDIAWRAQNRGWKAYYVPTAIAYHARGGTARKKEGVGRSFGRFYISDDLQFELIKNRYLAIIKNDTLLGLLLHLPFIFIYSLAELGFLLLFRQKVIPKLLNLPRFIKSALRKRIAAKRI